MDTKEAHGVFPLDLLWAIALFVMYLCPILPPTLTDFFLNGATFLALFFVWETSLKTVCQANCTSKLSAVLWQARRSRNHQMTYRLFSPMTRLKSQINSGPYALNEMSRSFMTCVKKLVSCSAVKRQIYCRKGTLCLTVMGKAVVATEWWIWLDKTPQRCRKSGFLILNQLLSRHCFVLCKGCVVGGIKVRNVEPSGCLFSPRRILLTFSIHYLLLNNFDLLTMHLSWNIDLPFSDNIWMYHRSVLATGAHPWIIEIYGLKPYTVCHCQASKWSLVRGG